MKQRTRIIIFLVSLLGIGGWAFVDYYWVGGVNHDGPGDFWPSMMVALICGFYGSVLVCIATGAADEI